jgi:hypothetical protein
MLVHDVNVLQTSGMLGAKSSGIGAIFAPPYTAMYRFLQKHRWIPSLHLVGVAIWILVATVLAGFAHEAQVQPVGVSFLTDFSGDDLQGFVGAKEFSEEIQIENEADETERSKPEHELWAVELDRAGTVFDSGRVEFLEGRVPAPRSAQYPNPRVLYLEFEVFRI